MNTGQSMLAIGAIILLSVITLRINNNLATSNDIMMQSKFGILATSLAQSFIQDASGKTFDSNTTGGKTVNSTTLLTASDELGPEGTEKYPNFDDFDDYNDFDTTITDLPSAIYYLQCKVCYVDPNNVNVVSSAPTWSKKITVTVTSLISKDTTNLASKNKIVLSSIYSYWYSN
ncbi:MAG: hypothetical protein ACFFD1_15675 [Candidatus Thorarchaeota archaeon]